MGSEESGRSASTGRGAAVRWSASLVVAAVLLSLTAGAIGGVDAGTASGTDRTAVVTTGVLDGPGVPPGEGGVLPSESQKRQRALQDSAVDICGRDASTFVGVYNSQVESVPGLVADRVRDSNVHLQVEGDANRDYAMVTDEDAQVVEYSEGKPEEASLRVETDCATFQEITDSERPSETFRAAYADGRIKLVGLGPVNYVFFEGLDKVTDPIAWAVLLGLFLLVLLVLYIFYRRLTLYYREGDDDAEQAEGQGSEAGPPPEEKPPSQGPQGPPDAATRAGQPSQGGQGQGQAQSGRNVRGGNHEPEGRPGEGGSPRADERPESRTSDQTEPRSGGGSGPRADDPTNTGASNHTEPRSGGRTGPGADDTRDARSGERRERRDTDNARSRDREYPDDDESGSSTSSGN